MFEKRLTWFWVLLSVVALGIVGRLVQIQVVQAAEYEGLAERILTRQPTYITAPRGTVFDRAGRPLLSDEPTANICVHYALIGHYVNPEEESARLRNYLTRDVARPLRRRGDFPEDMKLDAIVDHLTAVEVPAMWQRLSELTGLPSDKLRTEAERVYRRIRRWRRDAGKPVREEAYLLPVIEQVPDAVAVAARLELEEYPWLLVLPASRRVAHDADALVHLLGRLGAASEARIAADALRGDELRELRRGDLCGVSGVERLAEVSLRGTRGRILSDYGRQTLERSEPVPGRDVYLTIDLELQQHVLAVLEEAVRGDPKKNPPGGLPLGFRAGAAAVVIDVATREIRALVSYPTYPYESFGLDYDDLRRDRRRLPLTFRPVQAVYPPGSTCKVITLLAGLGEGVVTAGTRFHCTGFLLPENPTIFRCWIYRQHGGITHDMVVGSEGLDGEDAVCHSCNIYFFKVGGLLGPERLCAWFARCGLGQTQGTGLIEESPGVNPTEAWLNDPRRGAPRRHRASDAWNFAIGQGEVGATPLQAANVAATVASGYWAPVRVAYDDAGHALGAAPEAARVFSESHVRVARRGMWRVVNDPHGTAPRAKLDSTDFELCGKTGSAQAVQRVISKRYAFAWPDGRRESVTAQSLEDALATFGEDQPRLVDAHIAELFPRMEEGESVPSHAWFIGYTQPRKTAAGAVPQGPVYAISVLIEYGGSGGRVAGPVAKAIAEYLVENKSGD